MTEKIWLRLPETGGTFHCPVDAAEVWQGRGWEPCDQPAEPNPALAEWAPLPTPPEPDDPAPPLAEAVPKPTKRGGDAVPASTEGVSDVG